MKRCEYCDTVGYPSAPLLRCGAFHCEAPPIETWACYKCRHSFELVHLPDGLDLENPAPRFWGWIRKHTPNVSDDWGA